MYRTCILLFLVLFAHVPFTASQSVCTASVKVVEEPGLWEESHALKRVFELHITNTHSTCTLRESLTLAINAPAGARVGYTWGAEAGKVKLLLAPGQTHAGVGFVLSGAGTPTVTVTSIEACDCPGNPTLGPQNPHPTPTPEPTPTATEPPSTPAPTETPTEAPTTIPTTAPTIAPGDIYTLGLKFAILTCNMSDIRLGVAQLVLDSVGSQYDIINQYTWGTGSLSLTNADGTGKYYAVVATTELACWSATQQAELYNYTATFDVKLVILYTFPYATNGLQQVGGVSLPTTSDAYATFAPAMQSSTGALVNSAEIPVEGVYVYYVTISDATIATPALYLTNAGTQYVAAAFITIAGTTRLEFYLDQAAWATFPVILGTAWLQWVTNGLFAGYRRIEFNCHTDDIFMNTGMFDESTGEESETNLVRITAEDLDYTLAWQQDLNSRLPSGSNYTVTFPYNGATVKEQGGYDVDLLYKKAVELRNDFIWESHTWEHPYLDNLTYDKALAQYTKNVPLLQAMFNVTDINTIPNYCKVSTITPSISGLFNANALKALYDFGFRFVVGDNSRPELVPSNLYHTRHSTVAQNGFDGIIIVPRHATNIYYDGARPEDIVTQFNYHYSVILGGDLTFDQIVQRDVAVAVKALLSFRHDPFMFHQANLKFDNTVYPDSENHCLLSYWVEAVIAELEKYSNLPVISHDHDKLGQMFLDREARDACGFVGTVKYDKNTKAAVGLHATSSAECVFGISGVQATGNNVVKYETYGSSEKTSWLNMAPGSSCDVDFVSPVARL